MRGFFAALRMTIKKRSRSFDYALRATLRMTILVGGANPRFFDYALRATLRMTMLVRW